MQKETISYNRPAASLSFGFNIINRTSFDPSISLLQGLASEKIEKLYKAEQPALTLDYLLPVRVRFLPIPYLKLQVAWAEDFSGKSLDFIFHQRINQSIENFTLQTAIDINNGRVQINRLNSYMAQLVVPLYVSYDKFIIEAASGANFNTFNYSTSWTYAAQVVKGRNINGRAVQEIISFETADETFSDQRTTEIVWNASLMLRYYLVVP